ncbi:MAG: hypothetical protein GX872_03485 [Firmicutes bacterium]|nr:hypothetical protein [Bacillota bacterium]
MTLCVHTACADSIVLSCDIYWAKMDISVVVKHPQDQWTAICLHEFASYPKVASDTTTTLDEIRPVSRLWTVAALPHSSSCAIMDFLSERDIGLSRL